jgi:hypothetical protein
MSRFILVIVMVAGFSGFGVEPVYGQSDCDTLYALLQNLAVTQIRANEVWVEHFIDCPPVDGAVGGFVFSEFGQEGRNDRVVIARYYPRLGWRYQLGERAPRIRFPRPSPRIDVDGDGERDLVFLALDDIALTERAYRIVFIRDGKKRSDVQLDFPRGMVIDSLLPAPVGKPRPLQVIDRRAWEIGGLTPANAPVSYRYLAWGAELDPPGYINRTANNLHRYPVMKQREGFIESLPAAGDLRYETEEEYEAFLVDLIGWCLDQSNLDRELEGYKKIKEILSRVKYRGSTDVLDAPQTVQDQLRRALPAARRLPRNQNKTTSRR